MQATTQRESSLSVLRRDIEAFCAQQKRRPTVYASRRTLLELTKETKAAPSASVYAPHLGLMGDLGVWIREDPEVSTSWELH